MLAVCLLVISLYSSPGKEMNPNSAPYSQWSVADESAFFPAGEDAKSLVPNMCHTRHSQDGAWVGTLHLTFSKRDLSQVPPKKAVKIAQDGQQ